MPDTLTITDNRTGKTYEVAIDRETVRAMDFRQIKTAPDDFGLMSYDPAFQNTASCQSRITFIDGARGVLLYGGYPIEQLAERSSYLEVALLLLTGERPTAAALETWKREIADHLAIPPHVQAVIEAFPRDAHPMSVFLTAIGALSAAYPEAKNVTDEAVRNVQIRRLIAQSATIAASAFRHQAGKPVVPPDPSLGFTSNFLRMLFADHPKPYTPDPVLAQALDVLFILHADHEQNCSANAMRSIGSSQADPYSALAGATAALYGPLHGGANEAVLQMLQEIGDAGQIPAFIADAKGGGHRLMGFGHRVYKSYDPRARIIKATADAVFGVTGRSPLLEIALQLERIALEDEYFVKRRLYPNVDFYSGLIYQAMGFPTTMFTVLFAVARTAGWLAQWDEMLRDPDQKIARPRQIYTGATRREFPEA